MAIDNFDVTRATVKNVLNSQGLFDTVPDNVSAFEFNLDGTYKGCLIEPASTNLIFRSNDLDQWSITTGSDVSEVSSNTLFEKVYLLTRGSSFNVVNSNTPPIVSGDTYTLSFFAKKDTHDIVSARFQDERIPGRSIFNLTNGTASVDDGRSQASMEFMGDGWFRCFHTGPATTTTSSRIWVFSIISGSVEGSSLFMAGVQFEEGSVATSYIKTTDSASTRNADVIAKTGASDLIGQTEGKIELQGVLKQSPVNQVMLEIAEDTDNYIRVFKNGSNQIKFEIKESGVIVAEANSGVIASGDVTVKLEYQVGTCTLTVNGDEFTDTAASIPATSIAKVGCNQSDNEHWNGHLKVLALRK